ncbi:MAG: hypothetical protein ACJZ8O_01760 [Pirellulaceae bacterium]
MNLFETIIQNTLPTISALFGDCVGDLFVEAWGFLIPLLILGGIIWVVLKVVNTGNTLGQTSPFEKSASSGNATHQPKHPTPSGNRQPDLDAMRRLVGTWRNDGSISETEFAKLSGLISREEATQVSAQEAEPSTPNLTPVPLSQFKVESKDDDSAVQTPVSLSEFAVGLPEESDDGSPLVSITEFAADSDDSAQAIEPEQATPTPIRDVKPAVAREVSAPVEPVTPLPPKRTFSEVMSAFMESRNVRWFEFIAGISIIGSTIGLVATLHVKLQDAAVPYLTALLFMAFVAAIVGVGVYVIKRLKLPASGRATLLVGALLLPINFIAATVLEKHDVALTDTYFLAAIGLGVPALGALGWVALKHINRDHWVTYWIALMGPSFAQVIVKRVIEASDPGAFDSVWNVVGIMLLPLIPMVIGIGIHLKKMAQIGQAMTRDDAYSVFEILGLGGILGLCLRVLAVSVWYRPEFCRRTSHAASDCLVNRSCRRHDCT